MYLPYEVYFTIKRTIVLGNSMLYALSNMYILSEVQKLKSNVKKEFLEMLDFSEDDIGVLLADWERTTDLLELSDQDIRFAIDDWIPANWDISIRGVRLCIGAYIRELIEIARISDYKARGIKIVYGISPSQALCFRAIKFSGGDSVYVGFPDFLIAIVLGAFFNKLSVFTEDDSQLSERCRHCALNRTRINATLMKVIPSPDIIWSWRVFCDEAAKTEELLQCLTNNEWDYIISGMPHDAGYGEREDEDPERVAYLASQFQEGHRHIGAITGFEIKPAHMFAALKEYSAYTRKLDALTRLITNTDPQPVGGNELALFGTTISLTFNSGMKYFDEAIDCVAAEVRDIVAQGKGILPKGSPKLGCHFTPLCVPWIDRMFRENGVSLSFSSHVSFFKREFLPFSSADPYKMAAQLWLRHPNSVNLGFHVELMTEMLKEYDIDAMLYGFFSFDRWLGSYQSMTLQTIEDNTGIRHFYIEGDFWEDRNYKKTDRKGRIESIAYFLKTNKMFIDSEYTDQQKD